MIFNRSVVIGKFYPPHRGHKYLIDTATSRSHHVTVIVCAKPADTIPGELRAEWLREIHPTTTVMVIDDRFDPDDSSVWADNTIRWLGSPPDAVFSSEDYGAPYAQLMGCAHVQVDKPRITVPCSATMVRSAPWEQWHFLEPPVRAWYAKRVCVVGTQSAALAALLAEHFQTVHVPDYAREYAAQRETRGNSVWDAEEFLHIAAVQRHREDLAARDANRLVICESSTVALMESHRRRCGVDRDGIAAERHYDYHLLTSRDLYPWFEATFPCGHERWQLLREASEDQFGEAVTIIERLLPVAVDAKPRK